MFGGYFCMTMSYTKTKKIKEETGEKTFSIGAVVCFCFSEEELYKRSPYVNYGKRPEQSCTIPGAAAGRNGSSESGLEGRD